MSPYIPRECQCRCGELPLRVAKINTGGAHFNMARLFCEGVMAWDYYVCLADLSLGVESVISQLHAMAHRSARMILVMALETITRWYMATVNITNSPCKITMITVHLTTQSRGLSDGVTLWMIGSRTRIRFATQYTTPRMRRSVEAQPSGNKK